ncbi:nitrogen regulation protein NR(II) [Dehalobacter sp. TBBPA1]|uniref:two-component system sensor histidine kinase NtrB n=1 Tax=Dehalobacter sp. TBBPA1 TaxID=3235037 RepID=UPI0034A4D009
MTVSEWIEAVEIIKSERWNTFLECIGTGLHLKLMIVSEDGTLLTKRPESCPICHQMYEPFSRQPVRWPLNDGFFLDAVECSSCRQGKSNFSVADRARLAADMLSSFQNALAEFSGEIRTVELSALRKLNHTVISLCHGEENVQDQLLELILNALMILLDAEGSWLEYADSGFSALLIKGDERAVEAARLNRYSFETIIFEINQGNLHGELGVLQPRDFSRAEFLLPLMAEECVIAFDGVCLCRLLKKQLDVLLGAVGSAVVMIDRHYRIIYANRQAEQLMNGANVDLLGSPIADWPGPWLGYIRSNTVIPVGGQMDSFPDKYSDSDICRVDWQVSPLLEETTVRGWLLLLEDRTDYYRWQESARQAERFEATAKMVGVLAHELRNPISAASGLLQLMGRKKDPELTRNYKDLVLRELDRVTRLLNEFLLLGKPSNIEAEPIDPVAFLQELMPLFQGEAMGTKSDIILETGKVSPVAADPGQLTQVMLNLVRNAVQAADAGGRVIIRLEERGNHVCINVIDNGPGLTPEAMKNLFRPFFTTKERGTGLGLPIVRAIVHNHGGEITAFNREDGGAVFSMSFPPAANQKNSETDVLIALEDNLFNYPLEQALLSTGVKVTTISGLKRALQGSDEMGSFEIYPKVVIAESPDGEGGPKTSALIAECRTHWPDSRILLLVTSIQLPSMVKETDDAIQYSGNQQVSYIQYSTDLTGLISTVQRLLEHWE